MRTWIRRCFVGAVAVSLGGLLAGCDGNGNGVGGGNAFQVWFSILGEGRCNSVTVDVDLTGTSAILERDRSGDINCILDAALKHDGCSIALSEPGNGILRARIAGCTFPSEASLFRCGFTDVDVSLLQEQAVAECSCVLAGCDSTPPVCVGAEPGLDLCEVAGCDNGVDDDGDGLIDCEDTNCEDSPACEGTTSTTTTSNTFSTHTTSPPTTNPPLFETCSVRFRLEDEVTLGALQWTTDYQGAPGDFVGAGGSVECASLLEDSIAAFNDHDSSQVLESGLILVDGFTGPVDVAECLFLANIQPIPSDFVISNVEAGTPEAEPILPSPPVFVSSIDCSGPGLTTTTTQEGATTTTHGSGPTSSTMTTTTTTTTLPPDAYTVLIKLDTANAALGALSIDVDYANAPGGFLGSGGNVACSNQVPNATFAANDIDATRTLRLGHISLASFSAPVDLAMCEFRGSKVPTAEDFALNVVEAADTGLNPATVTLSVVVAAIP